VKGFRPSKRCFCSTMSRYIVAALLMGRASLARAQCIAVPGPARIASDDRRQLGIALLQPNDSTFLDLLTDPCRSREVRQVAVGLGARVAFTNERVGFLRLHVVPRAFGPLFRATGVQAVSVARFRTSPEGLVAPQDRTLRPPPPIRIPVPQVATSWAGTRWQADTASAPYFASAEIGLDRLRVERPEADGRGIRVAFLDLSADLLHPELGPALDRDGHEVPKVADVTTIDTPGNGDAGWVVCRDSADAVGGEMTARGRRWRVPHDGRYHLGTIGVTIRLGVDSAAPMLPLSVGVLWEHATNLVWVDTDGDSDFTDERPLTDYGVHQDIGWFGARTATRDDRIPFAVQTDRSANAVYIHIAREHGTLVAAALAGNRRAGGLFDGAAPAAQLVDARVGIPFVPDLIAAAARPDVDVVNRSGWTVQLMTGEEEYVGRGAVERLLSVYRKPVVGYGPIPGTVWVNDYASPEMVRRNRQLSGRWPETINSGVHFPADGLNNIVLAPSASLGAQSRVMPLVQPDSAGRPVFWGFSLEPHAPDGYWITSNNSPTIPVVSGVLADVIGLARRDHVPYDGRRLMNALFASARLLDGFPTFLQGHGLVQADSLWHLLRRMGRAEVGAGSPLTYFTVERAADLRRSDDGAVRVAVEGFSEDRLGQANAGDPPLERVLWLTRRGGPAGARRYRLEWRGDRDVFALTRDTATMRRDVASRIVFRVQPAPGWRMAFLRLVDVAAGAVMQEIPVTVRTPLSYRVVAPFMREYVDTIPPRRIGWSYFGITDPAHAMRVTVTAPNTGGGWLSVRALAPPSGRYTILSAIGIDSSSADSTTHLGPTETLQAFDPHPEPGTWTIAVENRSRPEYESPYNPPAPTVPIVSRYRVEDLGVQVTPLADSAVRLVNTGAAVAGWLEGYAASVGEEVLSADSIDAAPSVARTVPTGTAALRASITVLGRPTGDDTAAVGDFYAVDCSTGPTNCQVAAGTPLHARGSSRLEVRDPKAGEWHYVVVPRFERRDALPLGRLSLRDAIINLSAYGSVAVGDTSSLRGVAARWTASVRMTATGTVGNGRRRVPYVAFRLAPQPAGLTADHESRQLLNVTPLLPEGP
jgi:hypothetical protein